MSIFDLLFIALFLASLVVLLVAGFTAIRGQSSRAIGILRSYFLCAGLYLGTVVVVSAFSPRRVVGMGEPRCFDDWCIAVEGVQRVPMENGTSYVAKLRVYSTARRVSQRENNVVAYVTDDRGIRYDPIGDRSTVPLNVLLLPQQSVATDRIFHLPADSRPVGIVIGHQGGFPISWFIIGDEAWFHKPAIVPIQ
ncbi:MAG: hypothetical protein ACLPWF_31145 [Bryobacteraceae bacterium]